MKMTSEPLFIKFDTAATAREYEELREETGRRGYAYFSDFLEALRETLKQAEEKDLPEARKLLAKAREVFPEPGTYSPAWVLAWNEMESLIDCKQEAMERIPPGERGGEWQIVMDNPYTNEPVVCYPALSFLEAAYLYGYFKPGLKRNEYIRMQKIQSLLEYRGESEN